MTTLELLSYLSSKDITLWADGDKLRYSAPPGALTSELRAELTEKKPEILKLLCTAKVYIPPLRPVSRDKDLPLSFAQQRLWFLDQLDPGASTYNIAAAYRLTGPLDVAAFERSINEIVRRHEILRTTFTTADEKPVQVIASDLSLPLTIINLQGLSETEQDAQVKQIINREKRWSFSLKQGPLLRTTMLRLAEDEHIFLLVMHHIISDGWSIGIIFQELSRLYAAFTNGNTSPLLELPIQYGDFAVWQRDWLQGEVLEAQLAYWKQQFSGKLPVLNLHIVRPRPAVQTFRGARQSLVLPQALTEGLKTLSYRENCTLFMTMLAAFATLLMRYSNQQDFVVGVPIANRNRAEIEGLLGFFVNTLALRMNFSGDPRFRDFLAQVRKVTLEAHAHQDLPFEKVVEELQPERHLSHSPLFQVMFAFQNVPEPTLKVHDLTLSPIEVDSGKAKFDLTLILAESEEGLRGTIEYNIDLLDGDSIKRMLRHFQTLLESIASDSEKRLSQLPLLTPAELNKMLVVWNDTKAEYPEDQCIHQLFEHQAEETPDVLAVVFGSQHLTYAELNARSNQLAHYLRQQGVGPEVPVGIFMERSSEVIIGLLGVLKAGGAYLPLDPSYPEERLAFMIKDAKAPFLLTQLRLKQRVPTTTAKVLCLDADWDAVASESQENCESELTSSNLAYIIYTSGSTGKPKGALIEHRSLVNYIFSCKRDFLLNHIQNLPVVTRLTFDASLKQIFTPLLRGSDIWILPDDIVTQPSALIGALNSRKNVGLNCVPSLWKLILDTIESNQADTLTENFRCLFLGGETLSEELIDRSMAKFPHLQIWNLYGPTETTVTSTAARLLPKKKVTIGQPIANTQCYILDTQLQPVPVGVSGELYIGGVGLARGYLNRPELTAEKFISDPFREDPAARFYKTGDLARYLADGNIEFLGRIDHQVKIRGFRIELGEVASVLGQHRAVKEAVVVAREEMRGDKRLVAYVVAAPKQDVASGELRGFLQQKLPGYMVPSAFVKLDQLPLDPNGKVDRQALPAPDMNRSEREGTYVAPRSPAEEVLAGIWCAVLGLERVGVHDNFFELGGHSLLAIQLISRINEALNVEVPVRCIFDSQTIAELAKTVVQLDNKQARLRTPAIERVSRSKYLMKRSPKKFHLVTKGHSN